MSAPAGASLDVTRYRALADRAKLLSWLSLGVMSLEGVVALVAGIMAGSIALSASAWTPRSRASPA